MKRETDIDRLLSNPVAAINLGIGDFAQSLEDQKAQVGQVDWAPPAEGDPEIIAILDKIL